MSKDKRIQIENAISYHEKQARLNAGKERAAKARRIEHEQTANILRSML